MALWPKPRFKLCWSQDCGAFKLLKPPDTPACWDHYRKGSVLPGVCYCFPLMPICLSHPCPFREHCPPTTIMSLASQGERTPHFTLKTSEQLLPGPHPRAHFLCLQPAASRLEMQNRKSNILEIPADHALATGSRQADACCNGWGSFPTWRHLPDRDENPIQTVEEQVPSGSISSLPGPHLCC